MLATIPADYPTRWYVQDIVSDAVQLHAKRFPTAPRAELESVAAETIVSVFRTEYAVMSDVALFA